MHRVVTRAFATAAILAATATLQSASAADLTRPVYKAPVSAPLYNWSGFYAGVNVGWGGSNSSANAGNFSPNFIAPLAVGQVPSSIGFDRQGVLGGGQIGYNYQTGAIVAGIEADFQGSDIHGSGDYFYPGAPGVPARTTVNSRLDWFGTVRGRVGFTPVPEALLYVTGGLAYGRVNSDASIVGTPPTVANFHGTSSDVRAGWTIGGGGEWAFAPRWSIKAEYLYVDLGSSTVHMTDPQYPTFFFDSKFEHREHIGRIGVNYKFGG